MLYFLTLFIAFFFLFFVIRLFRSVLYALAENSVATVNVMMGESDDDDEKIERVQTQANALTLSLVKFLGLLAASVAVGSVPILVYCQLLYVKYADLNLLSLYSMMIMSASAFVAFGIPLAQKDDRGYSELSRLLHRLALNHYQISNRLFNWEKNIIPKKGLDRTSKFIIVSGLARSGTTSLMNDLSQIECFVSLGYANMPFLLCPNHWAQIYNPKGRQLKERSHNDGIKIGLTSNEALEEYFFKVKANDSYIQEDHLSEYALSEEVYEDYLDYQSMIKLDNHKIYLAKNNNFILRYKSVRQLNDDFVMVMMYREPLSHAASLLEKHRHYTRMQAEDPFVLDYMNWLGHHEFGRNQKPFRFNQTPERVSGSKDSMDFWLASWINYYRYALTLCHPNTLLINYDDYCNHPGRVIRRIIQTMGVQEVAGEYAEFKNDRASTEPYSEAIYSRARELYLCLNSQQASEF